jgi:hypothetical protein
MAEISPAIKGKSTLSHMAFVMKQLLPIPWNKTEKPNARFAPSKKDVKPSSSMPLYLIELYPIDTGPLQ